MLTLTRRLDQPLGPLPGLPTGYAVRDCQPSDTQALGLLYYEAYELGVARDTPPKATADIAASSASA